MLIKYTGSRVVIRKMAGYEWNPKNNYLQDITDSELVLNLITHGPGDFAISLDDPLMALVGPESTEKLVLTGIISVDGLIPLKDDEIKSLAENAGISAAQIKAWIKEARNSEQDSQEDQ